MKKLTLALLLTMTSCFMILAGCQNKTEIPAAATKTEEKIDQYVQKVNQLYSDGSRKDPAKLTANKQHQIITAADKLDKQITPNLYMSGISADAKADYKAAQKDLDKITGKQPATSESESVASEKPAKKKKKNKVKTSAFFDKDGIVKADAQLGEETDYTDHPKQLADYQEAKNQLAAMAAVRNLFTDDNLKHIPANLSASDFPYVRALINKSTHDGFKEKYLAYVKNAENQYNTYSNNTQAATTQNTTTANQATTNQNTATNTQTTTGYVANTATGNGTGATTGTGTGTSTTDTTTGTGTTGTQSNTQTGTDQTQTGTLQ